MVLRCHPEPFAVLKDKLREGSRRGWYAQRRDASLRSREA
jgi:hypothetical protein